MIGNIDIDFHRFEQSRAEAEKVIEKLDRGPSRKIIIDAGTEGLISALRKHFALREKEMPKSSGFPWFGQRYPKKYFWRGTRGTSVAEQIRVSCNRVAKETLWQRTSSSRTPRCTISAEST